MICYKKSFKSNIKILLAFITFIIIVIAVFINLNNLGVNNGDEYEIDQLTSFFARDTERQITKPCTISEIECSKTIPDSYFLYFVNSSCSACISELLHFLEVFRYVETDEPLYIAANDTLMLSYYLSQIAESDDQIILKTSESDTDSISRLNGRIYKVSNDKVLDMIDLKLITH